MVVSSLGISPYPLWLVSTDPELVARTGPTCTQGFAQGKRKGAADSPAPCSLSQALQ